MNGIHSHVWPFVRARGTTCQGPNGQGCRSLQGDRHEPDNSDRTAELAPHRCTEFNRQPACACRRRRLLGDERAAHAARPGARTTAADDRGAARPATHRGAGGTRGRNRATGEPPGAAAASAAGGRRGHPCRRDRRRGKPRSAAGFPIRTGGGRYGFDACGASRRSGLRRLRPCAGAGLPPRCRVRVARKAKSCCASWWASTVAPRRSACIAAAAMPAWTARRSTRYSAGASVRRASMACRARRGS